MTMQINNLHAEVFGSHSVTALSSRFSARRALTLTEILAAVFVLSFGLMAAMSVLPFATYMLNRMNVADSGSACGRAAIQQILLAEWYKPEALADWVANNGYYAVPADPYIVDPLAVTGTYQPFVDAGTGLFAFNLDEIAKTIVNDPNAANRHFRWGDDAVFATGTASSRPTKIEQNGQFVDLAAGNFTWLYMVTPMIDPLVIFPTRGTGITTVPSDAVMGYEVAAAVFHRRDMVSDRRVLVHADSTINATGAYIVLTSDDPDVLDLTSIKWLLLTAVQPNPNVPINAQWYRITGYDDIQYDEGNYTCRVFLVGPDWKGAKDPDDKPLGTVHAILCDGVINVFQATIPK